MNDFAVCSCFFDENSVNTQDTQVFLYLMRKRDLEKNKKNKIKRGICLKKENMYYIPYFLKFFLFFYLSLYSIIKGKTCVSCAGLEAEND